MLDRVAAARRESFVGRARELAAFQRCLADGRGLVYVHGPGGVGKSALLRRFAWLAESAGRPVVWVDGREAGRRTPAPGELLATAGRGTAGRGTAGRGTVLLVDAAERLGPLDRWFDGTGDAIAVLASRDLAPLAWRVDPAWRRVLRALPLDNLAPAEASALLAGVPAGEHETLLGFTRGHPLALALVRDSWAQRGRPVPVAPALDVVRTLVDGLLDAAPSPAHRAALEACAVLRVTTEPLLATLVGAPELFDWLRGLSIVETTDRGLRPHDLVRDALLADLRWRDPARVDDLRRRATAYYRDAFVGLGPAGQHAALVDGVFLHRDHPLVAPLLTVLTGDGDRSGEERFVVRPAGPADADELRAMVTRHEGDASAALAEHWLGRQPRHALVVRDGAGRAAGYLQLVALDDTTDDDRRIDPAAAAAHAFRERLGGPVGPVTLVRFWLSRVTYQDLGPVQSAIRLHVLEHSLTTPGLALTLAACARPRDWVAITAHTGAQRVPAADFTVDGRPYGVFAHDWRRMPPLTWLAVVTGLEPPPPPSLTLAASTMDGPQGTAPEEFADAVKAALRDLNRVDRLGGSPLVRSRLVGPSGTPVERARVLQQVIRSAAGQLAESPRDVSAYRAVHHTYLQPAGTQRLACDLLNLPTSTYRRHLAAGVDHLTAILWQRHQK